MIRGIYISASGMLAETIRTDTLANNLANCNTAGYKKDVAINKNFEQMLIYRIKDGENQPYIGSMGLGTVIDEIGTIHEQGSLQATENPLNMAIEGPGYFTVQTQNGLRYTRDGSFTLNAQGQLVTMDGNIVSGLNGPIQVNLDNYSLARVTVDAGGRVFVIDNEQNDMEVGTLEIVSFADERQLRKQGNNLYSAEEVEGGPQPFEGRVIQKYLERSNANVVSDMVTLIATYRAYEINAKAIQSHSELMGKAVNEVGKV